MSSQSIKDSLGCWVSSFSEDNPINITNLYHEQAFLWGTLSAVKRDSSALIREYFEQIFEFDNRCVEINESNTRFFGDLAICNGLYTFSWSQAGGRVTTLARFSFVYIKKNGHWLIIEHHSSAIPTID